MSKSPISKQKNPKPEKARVDTTKRPWTIKNIDYDAREAAIKEAKRQSVTVGAWMTAAVTAKLKSDHSTKLDGAGGIPVPAREVLGPVKKAVLQDLATVEAMVEVARKVAVLSNGTPPSELTGLFYRHLAEGMHAMAAPETNARPSVGTE